MPLLSFTPQPAEAPLLSHCFPSAPGSLYRNSDSPSPCTPPSEKPLCLLPSTIQIHPLPTHTHPQPPRLPGCNKSPPLGQAVPLRAGPRWGRGRSWGPLPAPRAGGAAGTPRPAPGQRRRLRAPRRAREVFLSWSLLSPRGAAGWCGRVFLFPPFLCMCFSPPLLYPTGTGRGRSAPLQHRPATSGVENYHFF